jgi:hypothetical protein
MRVLSLLEAREYSSIRRNVPDTWIVRAVNLAQARAELADKSGGVYLFNPAEISTDALQAFAADSAGAGARIVLYGADGLDSQALIELVTNAHVEVVAPTSEGTAISITSVIAMPRRSQPVRVLRAIGPRILMLPPHCAIPAARLFTFLPLPDRAGDFYMNVGRSQATVCRYLQKAGLCAPLQLLNVARVARLLHILTVGATRDPDELAGLACFPSAESMRSAVEAVLASALRDVERDAASEELTARLIAAARRD